MRSQIQWDMNKYSVNNSDIDEMHEVIVDLINSARVLSDQRNPLLKSVVRKLNKAIKVHFSDEEKYMKSINYPGFVAHKKVHQELLYQLDKFVKQFEIDPVEIAEEFYAFLKGWVVAHICGTDQSYGKFNP